MKAEAKIAKKTEMFLRLSELSLGINVQILFQVPGSKFKVARYCLGFWSLFCVTLRISVCETLRETSFLPRSHSHSHSRSSYLICLILILKSAASHVSS